MVFLIIDGVTWKKTHMAQFAQGVVERKCLRKKIVFFCFMIILAVRKAYVSARQVSD